MKESEIWKEENSIKVIRHVCETDEGIKALFPEPEIHNAIFYIEIFVN